MADGQQQNFSGGQSVASNSFTSPMGGNLGDGAWNNMTGAQQPAQPPGTPSNQTMSYGATGAVSDGMRSPGMGSITQFATPNMQQHQQAMYNPPQNSPFNFNPPPQPTGNTAGMSFAQRSAMMQQQAGGGVGGNVYGGGVARVQQPQPGIMSPPLQQHHRPPVSQIHVPQQPHQQYPPQQPSNTYQGSAAGGAGGGGMSFAQRSQAMMQASTPQQQQQQQPPASPYMSTPGGSNALYPPTPQQQQQQQQQNSYVGTPQGQQQPQQQSQMQNSYMSPGQQPQQPPPSAGSYASRSAMVGQSQAPPQQQQPGMMPRQQQPGMMQQPGMPQPGMMPPQHQQQQQQRPRNPLEDPPEVIAQQQRLLTDATRKVQEHAYYMKQAMERNDLPTVLDRAAQMVGELGEHAHAHHHHHVHPPAPGATGSTTALQPKNYYELHLRALEELPTLEDYLLNLSQQQPQPQMQQQPMPPQQQQFMPGGPTISNPLMAAGATNQQSTMMGATNNDMMINPQMNMGQPQMQQQAMVIPFQQETISYTMKELYDCIQYCPNVLSRLYLQICASSALIRSGEVGARWVMKDIIEAVKCVQNPVRGLFLRHYLLQAFRDKLPDEPIPLDQIGAPLGTGSAAPSGEGSNPVENVSTPAPVAEKAAMNNEQGTVKDSYEFILANFIEMNKLWVRIQHLPGDGKSKEVRRRREKDRNELRILVGTNMVRLSSLDSITSAIYGQVILPTVLDHIVICADPLAQAYLMDCLVQVFPDEYHIETMPILLGVCPKLRDKVNIRTILQSLMDRLANYLADEELLDEKDSNQVKRSVALDSFRMFDECVQNVYNARGPKLNPKEVIRLQTALLSFSMKCYQGNLEQVVLCLKNCVFALQQVRNNAAYMQDPNMQQQAPPPPLALDEAATKELEKLLSIPLDELALGVLNLAYYPQLIAFLPWANRREVALTMLKAVSNSGNPPQSVQELDQLFSVIAPMLRDEHDVSPVTPHDASGGMERTANLMAGLGVSPQPQRYLSQSSFDGPSDPTLYRQDAALVSQLLDMLDNPDTDVLYEMLEVARNHLNAGKKRVGAAYMALVFASLKLARRIYREEHSPDEQAETSRSDLESDKPDMQASASAMEAEEIGDKKGTDVEEKEVEETGDSSKEQEQDSSEATKPSEEDANKEEVEVKVPPSTAPPPPPAEPKSPKTITCRKVFVFIQQSIASYAKVNPEQGVKLYLEASTTADKLGQAGDDKNDFGAITYELISQAMSLYEEHSATNSSLQQRCVQAMIGALLICRSLSKDDYEGLIMKASKYAAKMLKKPEQCEMVALCAHLFYVVGDNDITVVYSNPQRCLECLQRSLKLADSCTNTNPANLKLFVNLLDLYLFFFEKGNPNITANYITGLVALIKEHVDNLSQFGGSVDNTPVGESRSQFLQIVRYIKQMKNGEETKEKFASIDVSSIQT